jgi:gamma-glutamyltranspeptidase/glutathione hydrolase
VLPGVLTADDVAGFEATWEDAVTLDWHGHTVAKTGPWGQGPALLQVLQTVDAAGELDLDTVEGVHTLVEAWKLAMADREAWFGDSAEVPLDDLLDPGYAVQRASLIGTDASLELRPGSPGGRRPRVAAQALLVEGAPDVDATVGEPTVERAGSAGEADDVTAEGETRGDTCHVDVVDRWGMLVSATPSGGWLQSSPFVPEVGFALGSRLQMMWLEQGLPSSLVPGRRPRTTLTPTLVLRDGIPVLACGSPGGDQQDQWQSVFLLRHLVGGLSLQEAIEAPEVHTTSFPGSFHPRATEPGVVVTESRLDPTILSGLRARGHRVVEEGPWSLGRMCAVGRDPRTGIVSAGANPRGMQGYAVGR